MRGIVLICKGAGRAVQCGWYRGFYIDHKFRPGMRRWHPGIFCVEKVISGGALYHREGSDMMYGGYLEDTQEIPGYGRNERRERAWNL